MSYVFYAMFWIFGLFIGLFGLIQILIVLHFSFPFTKMLDNMGLLKDKNIINKRDVMTIGAWGLLIVIPAVLIYVFASKGSLIAFVFGIGISILLGFGRTGANKLNIEDYIESNKEFINIEKLKNSNENFVSIINNIISK